MSKKLAKLIEEMRDVEMTEDEKEEQRRSFAHGNANIENERVTREVVDKAAEQIRAETDGTGRR